MSYSAIVCRIKTRPHPNADRLLLGTALGNQVVVGKDTPDGELGVFFPTDGQLSHEMCLENGLYSAAAREKLGLPPSENVGFFSDKRRVRSQKFRGEKSDGFFVPLSYFKWCAHPEFAGSPFFKEGEEFTVVNGQLICEKYYTAATRAAMASGQRLKLTRQETKFFPKMGETPQWRNRANSIPAGSVIYITEKLHGTSGRYGKVLDNIQLPWWKRLINKVSPVFRTTEWRYLNGSRNVILEHKPNDLGFYGTQDFRYKVVEGLTLNKGEVIYFEIVGYVGETPIMPAQPIKEDLKDLRKTYGETMLFKYGQQPGTCDIYVYKIININEQGIPVELSYLQMLQRASELGLKTPPLLSAFMMRPGVDPVDMLKDEVEFACEGMSTLDHSHMREGCVIRVESSQGIEHIKHKSWAFGVLEGYIKDQENYIDTEEVA